MAHNFITNDNNKSLKNRITTLIQASEELKFLTGFFYFSAWQEIYEHLEKYPKIKLKVLIGLQVEHRIGKLVEYDGKEGSSQNEIYYETIRSMKTAYNSKELDNETYYKQVQFFLSMLEEGRLEIKKTKNPNHAKLYLFKLNDEHKKICQGSLITGSSNFTRNGLSEQEEFNVEIKDYGFDDASRYFDELWESGIKITESPERKKELIQLIQDKSQVASVTPFEAYALVLKTYLDLHQKKYLKSDTEQILEDAGYEKFQYQIDAVNQALHILNEHNGVIISDVVGLGKSVIASLIAKNLGVRGMIICPPGLVGDDIAKTGWHGYINDFKLYDWKIRSRGKIDEMVKNMDQDIEAVIIDEAHYFRNQDTDNYEFLSAICKNKKVILLTATPFNNSPEDIYALLNLFVVPGKSSITLDNDLHVQFSRYKKIYRDLGIIMKTMKNKKEKALKTYKSLFKNEYKLHPEINIKLIQKESRKLSREIKNILSKIMIRRNRLDLQQDKIYSQEIDTLSKVQDPKELFYYFTKEQSEFYTEIIKDYFGEEGKFTGAMYQWFRYKSDIDEENLDLEENRTFYNQRNLYDFIRRLLVKRLESSFGAFEKSISRFLKIHKKVKNFIENTDSFIANKKLISKIKDDEDLEEKELEEILEKYDEGNANNSSKKNKIYKIKEFKKRKQFLEDMDKDLAIFQEINDKIIALNLVNQDPKRHRIIEEIKKLIKKNPNKKIIVFSEYIDTIRHLKNDFNEQFNNRVLVCDGNISKNFQEQLNENFNAQHKKEKNEFDILLTSDRLSEGYNLNRAGIIINYDIPWNPTRVIQRVGRINRIGKKVFEELSIYNFFPSEIGADIVNSKAIAQQKMFLIHQSLGEDAKIFDIDEDPKPAKLFEKLTSNLSDIEKETLSLDTKIRNLFEEIKEKYPEVIDRISELPYRIKTAKSYNEYQLNILRKKGLSLFVLKKDKKDSIQEIPFEEFIENIACDKEEKKRELSADFWNNYEALKQYKSKIKDTNSNLSLEKAALEHLKTYIRLPHIDPENKNFAEQLIEDIKKYHSLPDKTLRRFKEKNPYKNEIQAFENEIIEVKKILGKDYLTILKKRISNDNNEIIIAIENQNTLTV